MSNEKPKNNRFAFTSLDGADENGIRAEVRVKVNKGKIKEIVPAANGGVVKIGFDVEKAKYPIAGWAPTDSDAHKEAQRALETGEEVEYRIESQRRIEKGAERATPIHELDANSQVKSLVVSINGKNSGEAVTNPAEDNRFNGGAGRYVAGSEVENPPVNGNGQGSTVVTADQALNTLQKAVRSASIRGTILDALAAQALLAGATPEQVNVTIAGDLNVDNSAPRNTVPAGHAIEGKPWQDYNSDGRVNLGSARISAGTGVENLVFKHLAEIGGVEASNSEEVSQYLSSLIFAICDTIQAGAYGQGARPDRSANSHARIRGIVYETIQKHYTIPVTVKDDLLVADDAELKAWGVTVGRVSRARFLQAVQVALAETPYSAVQAPASLTGKEPVQASQPAPVASQAHTEAPVAPSAPAPQAEQAPAAVQATPTQTPASVPAPTAPDASQNERIEAARAVAANPGHYLPDTPAILDTALENSPASTGLPASVFPPVPGSTNTSTEEETATAVESFKEMLTENGMSIEDAADMAQVSSLLRFTFGKAKASEVDVEDLYNFIDHYVLVGAEGMREAVTYSYETGQA